MDAARLAELLTQIPFVLIFLVVLREAIRRPYRASIDIALFFGALTLAVLVGWVADLLVEERPRWVVGIVRTAAVSLPYLLLRIVADFADVPKWLVRAAETGLAAGILAMFAWLELPVFLTLAVVAYFVVLSVYSAVMFVRASRREHGVTSRRMRAAAGGSTLLGIVILIAGARAALGETDVWGETLLRIALLGSGLAYLAGFAPPALLRQAWQQPELRAFLSRVAELPWLGDATAVVRGIEAGAAASFGTDGASVLLWDPAGQRLRPASVPGDAEVVDVQPGEYFAGRAFSEGRPLFTSNAAADDPANARVYERWNTRAIMAAPIVAGGERIGVLTVYGRRAPVFAGEDLELVQLLADQAAVTLESRRLLEEAAGIRAREEATRLRDDFLSAAAHDLRTPLTSIKGYAQLLRMKAEARPDAPVDIDALRRINGAADQLEGLVVRLLDARRAETGQLVSPDREEIDLADLAREICERRATERHPCAVIGDTPVVAAVDRVRVAQLLENLIENAKKYSPDGGEVAVKLWPEPKVDGPGGGVRISVSDRGIGIPAEDVPHVFERFRRASNIDDRRFAGMGLGLYICRMIAEQHGGRIWVDSRLGEGSTFHVALPRAAGDRESAGA